MVKNILITGGAGFIGSRLANNLLKEGHNVRVLDNLSPQIHGKNGIESSLFLTLNEGIDFIKGDILDRECVRKSLESVNIVYHLAAETGTGQSMYEIERYTDVNVKGTSILLEEIEQAGSVERIILSSSRSVYGEGEYLEKGGKISTPGTRKVGDILEGRFEFFGEQYVKPVATRETARISTSSIYASTKYMQEMMIRNFAESRKIEYLILRFQNVYGPGQSLKNPYTGIISIFSNLAAANKNISVFEDGHESRDFIFIEDVVSALSQGIYNKSEYRVINVGTGESISVLKVAESIKTKLNSKSKISITGQFRAGDIRHCYANIERLATLIDINDMVKFNDGISRFLEWFISENLTEIKFEDSIKLLEKKGLLFQND